MILENNESKIKPIVDNTDMDSYDSLIFEIEKDEIQKESKIRTRNTINLDYFD